jgi:hypothetical protein
VYDIRGTRFIFDTVTDDNETELCTLHGGKYLVKSRYLREGPCSQAWGASWGSAVPEHHHTIFFKFVLVLVWYF